MPLYSIFSVRISLLCLLFVGTTGEVSGFADSGVCVAPPDGLLPWLGVVQRDGFELLVAKRQGNWYFAVFETSDGKLAICRKPVDITQQYSVHRVNTDVTDSRGKDAMDFKAKIIPLGREIVWQEDGESNVVSKAIVPDGYVIALKPNLQTVTVNITLIFKDDGKGARKLVFQEEIELLTKHPEKTLTRQSGTDQRD